MTARLYSYAEMQGAFPGAVDGLTAAARSIQQPTSNTTALSGRRPAIWDNVTSLPNMNAAAQTNLEQGWFGHLPPEDQNAMLRQLAAHPEFQALADQLRDTWLPLIFGFADAFAEGATEAKDIAREWSRTSPRFTEAGFNSAWNSFLAGRGITLGTLLRQAAEAGFDIGPWREKALAPGFTTVGAPASGSASTQVQSAAPFFQPVQTDAQHLYPVDWIITGIAQRRSLTIFAGAGGTAKTATAICLGALIAAGRPKIGPFTVVGTNLCVAMLSAEEPTNRVNLLTTAAGILHGLTAAEWAAVKQKFVQHDATKSGWRLGAPRPNIREDIAPEAVDAALNTLRAALITRPVDVLILDTLSALIAIPNEIDNGLVTQLLRRLSKLAQEFNCAIVLLHHSQKRSRESLATSAGDPEMIRGGGAITNVARVAATITALADVDATRAILAGEKPEFVRVITQAKNNDAAFIDPVFLTTKSVPVKMANGKTQDVRAVEFITLPPLPAPGASPIVTPQSVSHAAIRQAVLAAIQQGVPDAQGARVPIAPAGTGRRAASTVLAQAIQGAIGCSNKVAAQLARREVDALLKLRAVVDQDVRLPLYKPDGSQNGTRAARGLEVVPGVLTPAPPSQPTVPAQPDVPDATQAARASDSKDTTGGNAEDRDDCLPPASGQHSEATLRLTVVGREGAASYASDDDRGRLA